MLDPTQRRHLEHRLADWRESLRSQHLDARQLDELEDHLISSFEQELEHSVDPSRAWERCVARLGTPDELAAEFSKVAAPSRFEKWLLYGVVTPGCVLGLVLTTWEVGGILRVERDAGLALHVGAMLLAYVCALTLGLLGSALALRRLTARWAHAGTAPAPHALDRMRLARTVAYGAAIVAILCGYGLAQGSVWVALERGVAWSWDPRELGAASVFLYHGATAWLAHRRPERHELLISLASGGGGLTLLAWFGAQGLVMNWHSVGGGWWLVLVVGTSVGLGLALQLASRRGSAAASPAE